MSNLKKKKRIIFSCRDPATAYTIINFIIYSKINSNSKFDYKIFAQSPAYNLLVKKKNSFSCKIDLFEDNDQDSIDKCMSYFETYRPTGVITGISGPDHGIDEVLLKIANEKRVKSFGFQNYWGDTNQILGSEPEYYLVIDNLAKKITKNMTKNKIEIVGSMKNQNFHEINLKKLRQSLKNDCKKTVFNFAGQPLPLDGYLKSIELFANFIDQNFPDSIFNYRIHHKEQIKSKVKIKKIFNNKKINFSFDKNNTPLENFLVDCDVLVSMFSTCCYELQYLSKLSAEPLGVPLYLMIDEEVQDYFLKNCKLNNIPLSNNNMALVIKEKKDLKVISNKIKIKSLKNRVWKSIQENFNISIFDSKKVLNLIDTKLN